VAVGSYLSSLIPMETIKIVAGVAFLVFGLWTLRGDKIDDEDQKKVKFSPVITVAIAFFIAEMGDKTQLMTIAIAADSKMPLFVLTGTTLGMLVADGIGIIGGAWMCRHIPEKYIKWGAGIIFIFFGTLSLFENVPGHLLNIPSILCYFILLIILIYLAGVKFTYAASFCKLEESKDSIN
jgi:putative Ca2+/H+ antiporter (TMEM165/GDT1 family)